MKFPQAIKSALAALSFNDKELGYYSAVLSVFKFREIPKDRRKHQDIVQVVLEPTDWVYLEYNPDRLNDYINTEWAFLLAHESGHLLLEHLRTPKLGIGDDQNAWTLAQEAAINDRLLTSKVGQWRPRDEFITTTLINQKFNLNVPSGLTDEEIYEAIRQQSRQETRQKIQDFLDNANKGCGGAKGDDGSDGAGGKGDEAQALVDGSEPGSTADSMTDRLLAAAAEAAAATSVDVTEAQKVWGTQALGMPRNFVEDEAYQIPWEHLLAQAVASKVRDERQVGYNRKWAHVDKKRPPMIAWREVPDPQIVCYVDLSGSIDNLTASKFRETMKRFPKAEYFTFDHGLYPVVNWDNLRGGGGTDFQQLADHAEQQRIYPDVCVVLTDGYAATPKVSHKDRWIWVIIPVGNEDAIKGCGKIIKIPQPK